MVPKLRLPILLVHGLLGFDRLQVFGWRIVDYFPGIPEFLEAAGNRVLMARLHPTGGIAQRAAQLKAHIDRENPSEPVHMIAHSMGGLDARYMISRLGMAGRVRTLTTLGTPHRGSAFADWGVRRLARVVRPFFSFFDISPEAFYDLTTTRCQEFNEQVPDVPEVRYFSVAGRFQGSVAGSPWQLSYPIVQATEGPNDGVVSVASASYGARIDLWEGDHLSLVNWQGGWVRSREPNRLEDYAGLVRRLAEVEG